MASPMPASPAHGDGRASVRDDRDTDRNFLPDFAWAAAGGGVFLVAGAVVLMLAASSAGGSPITAYGRELAAVFMSGFLVVLVARTLSARSA